MGLNINGNIDYAREVMEKGTSGLITNIQFIEVVTAHRVIQDLERKELINSGDRFEDTALYNEFITTDYYHHHLDNRDNNKFTDGWDYEEIFEHFFQAWLLAKESLKSKNIEVNTNELEVKENLEQTCIDIISKFAEDRERLLVTFQGENVEIHESTSSKLLNSKLDEYESKYKLDIKKVINYKEHIEIIYNNGTIIIN